MQKSNMPLVEKKPSAGVLFFLFLALFFIVLNPYTIYGKPGLLVAFALCAYSLATGIPRILVDEYVLPVGVMFFIASIGLVSSVLHGITQFNHLMLVLSLSVTILAVYGIWLICQQYGVTLDNLIFMLIFVIIANSLIVLLELNYDNFRLVKESFLDPLKESSIDYSDGFRFRGVASAGGANLSLSVPAAITMVFYLFKKGKVGIFFLAFSSLILVFSASVIGRTGLILILIPVCGYLVFGVKWRSLRSLLHFIIGVFLIVASAYFLYDIVIEFLGGKFGDGFLDYSFRFLFSGKKGLDDEGTVNIIVKFLTVIPNEFPETFFGYGFYGGSQFTPWTDSGYARMFLSVGYLFGFIFYMCIFRIYFSAKNLDKYLVYSFVALLAIAETKEPLLTSGYCWRIFLIILIFSRLTQIAERRAIPYRK